MLFFFLSFAIEKRTIIKNKYFIVSFLFKRFQMSMAKFFAISRLSYKML